MGNRKVPNSDMEKTKKRVIGDYKKGLKPKELSEKYGVSINTVKSWISRYKSKNAPTEPGAPSAPASRKPGAPLGNSNAVGNAGGGAPPGNRNAVKHGGYARITSLSEDEKEFLEDCDATSDEEAMLEHEIKLLTIRISRLMKQISADKYAKGLYVDYLETSETKRKFKTPEDEEEYNRLVQEEIDRGDRKPGEQYKVHTITKNADEFILSVHEAINRAQTLRQRCLDSLAKLRAEKRENNPTTDIEDLLDLREAVFGVHETQDQRS